MSDKLDFAELKASGVLPSPKGVALTIMKLCQRENVSLPELAHTIQADPVLAGRIIKIANVANPNKSRPIAAVTTDTLILIGIHAVRQVVLSFSLISNNQKGSCKGFDYQSYWSRSVAVASAAQAIGASIRIAPPAELFTCGLLSDVGRLGISAARPEAYTELLEKLGDAPRNQLVAAEKERFGLDHNELSMEMMADWGIPKLFSDAVYYSEDPESSGFAEGSRQRKLTYALQLAELLADAFLANEGQREKLLSKIFLVASTLSLSPEHTVNIANQTLEEWHDWGRMLDVSTNKIAEFSLPQSADSAEPAEETTQATAVVPLRILLTDDDETLLFMMEKLLGAAGHTIYTARNGREALESANKNRPQVIIADWVMPELDGVGLCRQIRNQDWGREIFFIMLTVLEDERSQIDAFEAGADAYLRKPFNPRLLNAKLLAAERRFYPAK